MKPVPISSLLPETIAQTDYFSERGELLISKGTPITARHLDMLFRRNNHELYVAPASEEEEINQILARNVERSECIDREEYRRKAPGEAGLLDIDVRRVKPGRAGLAELSKSRLAFRLDEELFNQTLDDRPAGYPLRDRSSQMPASGRSVQYKNGVSASYHHALGQTSRLLERLASGVETDANELETIVSRFVKIFITDRNILLNISNIKTTEGDYLFHHSLNVCLLSINVAAASGYSEKQVLEIGMGALVHDVGMLLVQDVRAKPSRLSQEEWYEIQKHPVIGMHLLERLKNMPRRVPYIAYQVHERENATGYPKQRGSRLISRFAKMVQVADVYEALTSPRPHRPSVKPSDGIDKIVRLSREGFFAEQAVTALLEYVSYFPVGSLVELGDRRVAKVVDANQDNLYRPVVRILTDEKGVRLDRKRLPLLDLMKKTDVEIARGLPFDGLDNSDVMEGF